MTLLRTPGQASYTFDLGGPTAPRPKGMFYVRFKRGDYSQGPSYWERDLGFLVKTTDTPTVTPKVEEVNQYNKKRQIYTGYTTQPISMTLYDTADGMALRMWDQYVRYYFSDFNQDPLNYKYDMLPPHGQGGTSMLGEDIGYGFTPRPTLDVNSQFFFDAVEIFQVFRNAYTKVTLANPKITSWDTEELDYEQMGPVMHRLQIAYEQVLYHNGGAPSPIDDDPILSEAFRDIRMRGDILEVTGIPGVDVTSLGETAGGGVSPGMFGGLGDILPGLEGLAPVKSGIGGVLGSFGNFNFGAALGTAAKAVISGRTDNLASELVYSATGNAQLATILNMVTTGQSEAAIAGQVIWGAGKSGTISPAVADAAQAAVAMASGNKLAAGALAERVVQGVLTTSTISGQSAASQVSGKSGFSMAPAVYEAVNATRSVTAQIGFKNPFGKG